VRRQLTTTGSSSIRSQKLFTTAVHNRTG
jgi:hypothetical protein